MTIAVNYFEIDVATSILGLHQTTTATMDAVDPLAYELMLHIGLVNKFGNTLSIFQFHMITLIPPNLLNLYYGVA